MPSYLEILEQFLSPVLSDSAPVTSGALTVGELCELFERVVLSAFMIPDPGGVCVPDLLADMWAALVAHGPPQPGRPPRPVQASPDAVAGVRAAAV